MSKKTKNKTVISDTSSFPLAQKAFIAQLSVVLLTLNNQGDHSINRSTLAKQIKLLKRIRISEQAWRPVAHLSDTWFLRGGGHPAGQGVGVNPALSALLPGTHSHVHVVPGVSGVHHRQTVQGRILVVCERKFSQAKDFAEFYSPFWYWTPKLFEWISWRACTGHISP